MTFARFTRLMAINRKISSNDPNASNASNDPNALNDPCLSNSLTIKEIPPLRLVEEGIAPKIVLLHPQIYKKYQKKYSKCRKKKLHSSL